MPPDFFKTLQQAWARAFKTPPAAHTHPVAAPTPVAEGPGQRPEWPDSSPAEGTGSSGGSDSGGDGGGDGGGGD